MRDGGRGLDLRVLAPPLLLALVALRQVGLAHTAALSPWKGGGFGMFAAIDGSAWRELRAWVEAPGRSQEIDLPPSLAEDADKACLLPGERRLAALAVRIAARERRHGRDVTRVRLLVSGTRIDPDTLLAQRTVLRRFDHDVAASR